MTGLSVVTAKLTAMRDQLPYLPRALGLVWAAARGWTVAWLALLLIQGVLPVAIVYLTRALVDGMVVAMGSGGSWEEIRGPLLMALVMAVLMVISELLRAVVRLVRTVQGDLVRDYIKGLIHERATSIDLAYYESPKYHDQLHRARSDSYHRPIALIESLGGLIQNGLTLLAMAAVLVPYGWWVPLALLTSTLPALWVVLKFAVLHHTWQTDNTARERRSWYLDWLLTDRAPAPELRLFALEAHFSGAYQKLRGLLRGERLDLARSEAWTEMAAGGFALAVMGATVALMLVRAMRGAISLGALAMFYQAFNQGQKLLRSLLENVAQFYSNILFLGNLFEFLEIAPEVVDPPEPAAAKISSSPAIVFRGLTFRYPSSEINVFEGFDLEIEGGKVVALLGVNGAGKSTLIKLLCRLYDPLEGRVEIDGQDIRSLRLAHLRRLMTVLFQEPVHYSETVRRNVEMADLKAQHEAHVVQGAINAAGAQGFVDRLPKGSDTLLGTWFKGGAELSLGEWQRIALARAIFRDAPIVLLDEPTSAMDSWAEADWAKRFRKLVEGRTAIIISHRFTTARNADLIHVLEEGRIFESGTHEELLRVGGRYARSWAEQTS